MSHELLMHDPDAERSLLSCVLFDAPVLDLVGELAPEHFHDPRHAALWRRLRALWDEDRGAPLDLVRVLGGLRPESVEALGGAIYLAELHGLFFPSSSAPAYANCVREWAAKRELLRVADAIARAARDPETKAADIVQNAGDTILRVRAGSSKSLRPMAETIPAVVEALHRAATGEATAPGLRLGIDALDVVLGGVESHALVVVGARTSVGKTAFALDVTRRLAARGDRVLVFSLEMSHEELGRRFLGAEAGVAASAVRSVQLKAGQLEAVRATGSRLMDWPVWVDDAPGLALGELLARATHHKVRFPDLALIVVDYVQLVEVTGLENEPRLKVGRVSKALKGLAKRLGVPVLALAQLNRGGEGRDEAPRLTHLKESGSLEEDADVVLLLSRKTDWPEGEPPPPVLELRADVAKNRNGATRPVSLWFTTALMRFDDRPPQATAPARLVAVGTRHGRGGEREESRDR